MGGVHVPTARKGAAAHDPAAWPQACIVNRLEVSMPEFRRILVPHDFSDHATGALRVAARLAAPRGRIVVLHVIAPFTPVTDVPPVAMSAYIPPEELVASARTQLDRVLRKALPPRVRARTEARVVIGDPYQRIVHAARGMDAIVMSTAGRTGLSHLLIGSVAEKVVRHSPIPVVTLRPEVARKAARGKR
jgi:nucleotide-binding universal stress UspA family protein